MIFAGVREVRLTLLSAAEPSINSPALPAEAISLVLVAGRCPRVPMSCSRGEMRTMALIDILIAALALVEVVGLRVSEVPAEV